MKVDAIYRGRFVTFSEALPETDAVAVLNGRIVALGRDTDGLRATVEEHFGTAVAFPGFHDAHCHTTAFGLRLGELDLSSPPLRSMQDLYEAVHAASLELAPGAWIIGGGYDQNKLGGRHPARRRLDEAAGGRPVWLQHTSGHMCAVNSPALALIGPRLGDPVQGGVVERDAAGEPTGLLQERAQVLVQSLVLPRSVEELAGAIGRAHDRYLAEGLTSVCDAGVAGGWVGQSPVELAAYQLARDTGRLKVRTTAMITSDAVHAVRANAEDGFSLGLDAGIRTGLGDEWLRIGAQKIFADGSLIGRTCWMHEGFADDPGNTGYPHADPGALREAIIGAHLAGWQVATHAIGDAAVDFVLDCYEEALRALPRKDHRHRIEHCGLTSRSAVERIARLGVVPVPQGRFVGEIGDGMLAALGPRRSADAYRLASFTAAGVALPGSSDRPVVDGRPMAGVADMVRRRTESGQPFSPGEALTPEQALRSYTLGSAFAVRAEHERGALEPGKLADLTVLGADPRGVGAPDIAGIPVEATVVGGKLVFASER